MLNTSQERESRQDEGAPWLSSGPPSPQERRGKGYPGDVSMGSHQTSGGCLSSWRPVLADLSATCKVSALGKPHPQKGP